MKKRCRFFMILISIILVISFMPLTGFAEELGDDVYFDEEDEMISEVIMEGSGTKEDPYQIRTKYDLDKVRNNVKASYILMNDIIFDKADFLEGGDFYNEGKLWEPFVSKDYGFRGSFDGNGYTIEGIKIGSDRYSSIFGGFYKSTIKDLTLRNIESSGAIFGKNSNSSKFINCTVYDTTKSNAGGGFVDWALNTTFENCTSYVCITNTIKNDLTGGIAGDADGCTFYKCKNYGNIKAKYCAGGIVGRTSNSYANKISYCENYGHITALDGSFDYNGAYAGGIVGEMMASDTTIKNSFNIGKITGETRSFSRAANAGGIAGQSESSIIECYNAGVIMGIAEEEEMVANTGGISGVCKSTIINSFNSGEVKSVYRAGGITAYLTGESARISKCYNVGQIAAVETVSGITTNVSGGATISNTYYLNNSAEKQSSIAEINANNSVSPSMSSYEDTHTSDTSNSNSEAEVIPATASSSSSGIKKYGNGLSKTMMEKKSSYKNFDFSSKWAISSKKNYKYPTLRNITYKEPLRATDFKLSYTKTTYTGKAKKAPTLTIKDNQGKTLVKGVDFTVTGLSNKTSIGRYAVKIKLSGNYSGTKTLYYAIVPKAPASAKANLYGYDDVKFSWSKVAGASGYNIYYKKAVSEKYTFYNRTTNATMKIANLTDGVKYSFKVVPYYKSGGVRYSSLQSKTASIYTLKKLNKPKVVNSGTKVKVSWNNINGATGYQYQQLNKRNEKYYSLSKKRTVNDSVTIRALKNKTRYYRVRAYKKIEDTYIYGPWSDLKAYKRQ